MARLPSEATQIRTLRRQLSEALAECRSLKTQRDTYQVQLVAKVREVNDWNRRFDALLKILPEQQQADQ